MTWGQVSDLNKNDPNSNYSIPTFASSNYNIVSSKDPINLIDNVSALPEGTKVSWEEAPVYDKSSGMVTNDPIIKIEEPNKNPILLTLTKDKNGHTVASTDKVNLENSYRNTMPTPTWGKTTVTVGNQPNPSDLLTDKDKTARLALENNGVENPTAKQIEQLKEYLFDPQRWSWEIAPDTSKPGYTVAFAKFKSPDNDNEKENNQVLIQTENNGSSEENDWLVSAASLFANNLYGYTGVRLHVVPATQPSNPDPQPQVDPDPNPNPNPQPDPKPDPKPDPQPNPQPKPNPQKPAVKHQQKRPVVPGSGSSICPLAENEQNKQTLTPVNQPATAQSQVSRTPQQKLILYCKKEPKKFRSILRAGGGVLTCL